MLERQFRISTDTISKENALYTIGFAELSTLGNVEDAVCAGSGSLVTIGPLYGILTAAHVLNALSKTGPVGIVSHADDASKFQKQVITMEHTEPLVMNGNAHDQRGPDLGFLRLPEEGIGWLKAKNSFYNLSKRRQDVLANKDPAPSHVYSAIGMIHEFTRDAPDERRRVRRKVFTAIFCNANIVAVRIFRWIRTLLL